ncbi:MAG TPA: hypothetical protein VFZ97_06220 [Acidimicrobiales bacterium]
MLGNLPAKGPAWIWVVMNVVGDSGQTAIFEVATPGNSAIGYAFEWNTPLGVACWGVTEITANTQVPVGCAMFQWTWDPVTAKTIVTDYNNLSGSTSAAMSSQPNIGATTVTIGGSQAFNGFFLDAEVILVIVGTGTPATSDLTAMSNWLWEVYNIITGPSYNSPNHTTMPSKDYNGKSVTDAIELGAIYNSSGVFGHKYWMASSPFDSNFPSENPNIAFSDDGNTWSATGITNPVVPYPGGGNSGNNADPCLFDNTARDGTLYCLYVRENANITNGVRYATSTNGTAWTDQGFTLTGNSSIGPYYECPTMFYDSASNEYWLYTMSIQVPSSAVIYRQTSSTVSGSWSSQTACTLTIPGGRKPWHISAPIKIGSKYVIAFSDSDIPRNLWLASSTDGLNWTCATKPFVVPATSNQWDAPGTEGLYRPSIQNAGDGVNMLLWYVSDGSNVNYISDMVTVPQSVIP